MNVTVSMNLGPDDSTPGMTPEEMLVALGGDPTKDTLSVSVSAYHAPPPVEIAPATLQPPPIAQP